eukprot:1977281-Pleurochrysis_carterae.AAC.1
MAMRTTRRAVLRMRVFATWRAFENRLANGLSCAQLLNLLLQTGATAEAGGAESRPWPYGGKQPLHTSERFQILPAAEPSNVQLVHRQQESQHLLLRKEINHSSRTTSTAVLRWIIKQNHA